GNWLEAQGQMSLPPNLGSPGSANSRARTNAGPAIFGVNHAPVLPKGNQLVVVSARIHDPDGVASVTLRYRLDPETNYTALTMRDDATGGDAVAGDGLYSGTIPGQPSGALVAFYLQATDGFAPSASSSFPSDAPLRECLVRFGEPQPAGSFGTY